MFNNYPAIRPPADRKLVWRRAPSGRESGILQAAEYLQRGRSAAHRDGRRALAVAVRAAGGHRRSGHFTDAEGDLADLLPLH